MGWYHSHPFDVQTDSHCFLSTTDIATQLQWQRAEDQNGNPWVAIVIDPLRSLAKNKPEIGAFRVYPPEYTAPLNETPDGKIVSDDSRIKKWGAAWNRYYSLEVSYLMNSLSNDIMSNIQRKYMWMNSLVSSPMSFDSEYKKNIPERITDISNSIQSKLIKNDVIGSVGPSSSSISSSDNSLSQNNAGNLNMNVTSSNTLGGGNFDAFNNNNSGNNVNTNMPSASGSSSNSSKDEFYQQKQQKQSFEAELVGIEQCISQSALIAQSVLFSNISST